MTKPTGIRIREYVLAEFVGGFKDGDTAALELLRGRLDELPRTIRIPILAGSYVDQEGRFVSPHFEHAEYRLDTTRYGEYRIASLAEDMVMKFRGDLDAMVRTIVGPFTVPYQLQE